MHRKRRVEGAFHAPKKRPAEAADRPDQERRWREALREAQQSGFEIFEDRGPGVSVPPAGLARRDERGRR
jgi:hypothetical protein